MKETYRLKDGTEIDTDRRAIGEVIVARTRQLPGTKFLYEAWEPADATKGTHSSYSKLPGMGIFNAYIGRITDRNAPAELKKHVEFYNLDLAREIFNAHRRNKWELAKAYILAAYPEAVDANKEDGQIMVTPYAVQVDMPGIVASITTKDGGFEIYKRTETRGAALNVRGCMQLVFCGVIEGLEVTGESETVEGCIINFSLHAAEIERERHKPAPVE